jgi:hypothetical protein
MLSVSSGLKRKLRKIPAWSRQPEERVTYGNVGLFENGRDLRSQPISSHWLFQRTRVNQQETGE